MVFMNVLECFLHPTEWTYLYLRVLERYIMPKHITREQLSYMAS